MLLPSIFRRNFIDDFFNDFDDMLDFNFPTFSPMPFSRLMTTNIQDLGDEYLLEIELPGYDKKDISASLDNGYLTIMAHKEESKEDKKKGRYIRKERYCGSCRRSFYVGENLKEEDFKAAFENGILKIKFPKDKETAKLDNKKYIPIE
ncbi:MAG: Hsp20/alpha crystallin family protein [Clostridiales bacterium]|nr:Hsp20/alpha crystallin family protein [Clostridiales bacterium]